MIVTGAVLQGTSEIMAHEEGPRTSCHARAGGHPFTWIPTYAEPCPHERGGMTIPDKFFMHPEVDEL